MLLLEEIGIFENDGVRFENLEFTRKITPVLENCYSSRSVPVMRVPALPSADRLAIALSLATRDP